MNSLNIVLVVIVLVQVTIRSRVLGLMKLPNQESDCVVVVSRKESRYVPYMQTYRTRSLGMMYGYLIQTRVNYRIEYTTVWVTQKECCPGYEEQYRVCTPICKNPCIHGTCKAPDLCTCNPGYESTNNMTKCVPHCERTCKNGECVAPNVCSCNSGFLLNLEDIFSCNPNCTHGCVFGTCTAPNTCTCDKGYRPKNESVCEPICSQSCQRGSCIAPESCSCEDGYALRETSKYICEPICEKACINGACTAPGICTCNDGYWSGETDHGEPICKPFCKISCGPYGICTAPDKCTCFEGYRVIDMTEMENDIPDNVTESSLIACQPICNETCINGKCIGPDLCSCNSGYYPSQNGTKHICEPICEKPCGPNSVCIAPNNCICNPGYRRINDDVTNGCELICKVPCGKHGSCYKPNVCTCNDGYVNDPTGLCVPFCASSCQNGTCLTPNNCTCHDGFVPLNESVCVPFCENGCENGECVAPNECRCHDGFEINKNDSTGMCVSVCTRNCSGHGVCINNQRSCECSFGWNGWNCDVPTVCILTIDPNDKSIDKITIRNETSSTNINTRDSLPDCYQCNDSLNNETLCYAVQSTDGRKTIVCFINTESPCYMTYQLNDTANVSKLVGSLAFVTILLIAGATTIVILLFRRHRRRKLHSVRSTMFQRGIGTESLLAEEEVYLQ